MKPPKVLAPLAPRLTQEAGGALVMALFLTALASFLIAGWIYLIAARSESAAIMREAAQRRTTAVNARVVVRQYLQSNGSISNLPAPAPVTATWNTVTVTFNFPGWSLPAAPFNSASPPSTRVNPFAPAGTNGGFWSTLVTNSLAIPSLATENRSTAYLLRNFTNGGVTNRWTEAYLP